MYELCVDTMNLAHGAPLWYPLKSVLFFMIRDSTDLTTINIQLMIAASRSMRRGSTLEDSDIESVSSDEQLGGKPAQFVSRASQMFTGLQRGVSLLNIRGGDGQNQQSKNDLQDRYFEAKERNLFQGRGSGVYSECSEIAEDESLSDNSTFEMPMVKSEGEYMECSDNTGGIARLFEDDVDIDRLQLEIEAPMLEASTLNNISERSGEEQGRVSTLGPLPFFKGIAGKYDSNKDSNEWVQDSVPVDFREETKSELCRIGSSGLGWIQDSVPVNFTTSTEETGERRRKRRSWRPGSILSKSINRQCDESDIEPETMDDTVNTEKQRAQQRAVSKLMQKHFKTANNPDSFRELQKQMKEKGAVTGTSVRALLQDIDLQSAYDESEDIDLELEHTTKNFFASAETKPQAKEVADYSWQESNDSKHEELQQRLRNDPLFGDIDPWPYIHLPSREPNLQFLSDVIHCSTDEGRASLLTLHGEKYLGKSKLIDAVVENVQNQSQNSFTVLRSARSSNTTLTSFYPFREIVSSALRECDKRTRIKGENEEAALESDSIIVQRLIQRKIIDESDQLMISRMLPSVTLESPGLLSLLQGRSPDALTKDSADTLFKLMIPLQPVVLIFDAVDGDGDFDRSSWAIMEKLLLLSPISCPQMIAIVISRQPLPVPRCLVDILVDTCLKRITKRDSEEYIRSIFDPGCMDRDMTVDENVLQVIHSKSAGCPLFLERLILFAQRRSIIEIDETRNAVAINGFDGRQPELVDALPVTLNEEVLSEINNLPHNELDSLKVACCMGE